MKAPPKRKGNFLGDLLDGSKVEASMKAPPKRKGNYGANLQVWERVMPQ